MPVRKRAVSLALGRAMNQLQAAMTAPDGSRTKSRRAAKAKTKKKSVSDGVLW
jgi:hypothetical protein